MPRLPNHKSHMIGLAAVETAIRHRIPPESRNSLGTVPCGAGGVMLLSSPGHTPPVSEAFSGVAYLRRLAAHRRRIKREMAELPPLRIKGRTTSNHRTLSPLEQMDKNPSKLPGGRSWSSLRLVPCGACRRWLLGASDEHLRGPHEAARHARSIPLPPPIAGRDGGDRPLCARCLSGGDQ